MLAQQTDTILQKIADLIHQRTGFRVDSNRVERFKRCILERCEILGISSLEDYYQRIWFHPAGDAELTELINALLINETYFFRSLPQFKVLETETYPSLLRYRREANSTLPIRVWSAGCSIGCEPYSIAMSYDLWKENRTDVGVEITVLGTDISSRALRRAEEGVFNQHALQQIPKIYLNRYFHPLGKGSGEFQILRDKLPNVTFRHLNLVSDPFPQELDIIFCCNVLIYFPREIRRKIVQKFYEALKPKGYLFLGYSENLRGWEEYFSAQISSGALFYRKWSTDRRQRVLFPLKEEEDRRVSRRRKPPPRLLSEVKDGLEILSVSGPFDGNYTNEGLKDELLSKISLESGLILVIDLRECPYIENSALHIFKIVLAFLQSHKKRIVVVVEQDMVREALERSSWQDFCRIYRSFEDIPRRTVGRTTLPRTQPEPLAPRQVSGLSFSRDNTAENTRARRRKTVSQKPGEQSIQPSKKGHSSPSVRVESVDARVMVSLDGIVDCELFPDIKDRLTRELGSLIQKNVMTIKVDLSGVDFLDRKVITVLNRAYRLALEKKITFEVIPGSDELAHFLHRHRCLALVAQNPREGREVI